MSSKTTYTCDGCGQTAVDPERWTSPYYPHHGGTKNLCNVCTGRVLAFIEHLRAPAQPEERARELVREVTAKYDKLYREHQEQSNLLAVKSASLTREVKEVERWKREWGAALARRQELVKQREKTVADLIELLEMLGKKARKRHAARVTELEQKYLAPAVGLPAVERKDVGDYEVGWCPGEDCP